VAHYDQEPVNPSLKTFRRLAIVAMLAISLLSVNAAHASPRVVVLDVELTGDLGGPTFSSQHKARLEMASSRLRENLQQSDLYQVIGNAPAQETIDRLSAQHRYFHNCGECALEIGRELGADRVLVSWVFRVSALILTLNYEMIDVSTGQVTARKSFDFRGDNDTAWTRAIDYMVRDMKSEGAK
jgi:Protein of unknown function (DUF2380)